MQALSRFEDLVHTCNDLLDNLVHTNLASIKATCFLDLPSKQAFAVEDFLAAQTKAVKKHTEAVAVRSASHASSMEIWLYDDILQQ